MKKHLYSALGGVVAVVLLVVVAFALVTSNPAPAQADGPSCSLNILGNSLNLGVTCVDAQGNPIPSSQIDIAGVLGNTVTIQVPVPGPTVRVSVPVTLPPVTLPPLPAVTVRVPIGPQSPGTTQTVTPPMVTETVRVTVPGTTETVTVPRATTTVTAPGGRPTPPLVLEPTTPLSTVTATTTVTEPASGQQTDDSDTMRDEPDSGFFSPDIDFGDDEVTAGEIGLGTLTVLSLVALLLLALYGGYVLGYKDKERKETNFIRALLDSAAVRRGKHS